MTDKGDRHMADYNNELNVKEGLEYAMDSEEFYIEVLETYMEETRDEISQMDQYVADGNMEEYATLVHAVKSGSRLIGAMSLGDEAYELELKSKEGNIEYVRSNHDHLKEHVKAVYDAVNAYMAEKK